MIDEKVIVGIIIDAMDDLKTDIHFDIYGKEDAAANAASRISALAYEAAKPAAGDVSDNLTIWNLRTALDRWQRAHEAGQNEGCVIAYEAARRIDEMGRVAQPLAPMSTSGEMVERLRRAMRSSAATWETAPVAKTLLHEAASRLEALEALVAELADDLAAELEARYPEEVRKYPSQAMKFYADMEPVRRARALTAEAALAKRQD